MPPLMRTPRHSRHNGAARLVAALLLGVVALVALHAALPHVSASQDCVVCRVVQTRVVTPRPPHLPPPLISPSPPIAPAVASPRVARIELEAPRGPPARPA
jgi:hypothetical protein